MSSLWIKVQTTIVDNPKIIGLSDQAFRAFIEMMIYSQQHLSDGFIDGRVARSKWGDEVIDELMTNDKHHPSLICIDDGYELYNYTKYQTSASKVEEIRERAKKAGKQSAAKRAVQRSVEQAVEHVVEQRVQPEAEAEVDTEVEVKDLYNDVARVPYSDDFETWWASYPRRQQKGDAWKAWEQLRKQKILPALDELVASAETYGRRVTDPKFMKLPGGWLRAHGWADDVAQAKTDSSDAWMNPAAFRIDGKKPAWKTGDYS